MLWYSLVPCKRRRNNLDGTPCCLDPAPTWKRSESLSFSLSLVFRLVRKNEPTSELFSHWCSMNSDAQSSTSPCTRDGEGWLSAIEIDPKSVGYSSPNMLSYLEKRMWYTKLQANRRGRLRIVPKSFDCTSTSMPVVIEMAGCKNLQISFAVQVRSLLGWPLFQSEFRCNMLWNT